MRELGFLRCVVRLRWREMAVDAIGDVESVNVREKCKTLGFVLCVFLVCVL